MAGKLKKYFLLHLVLIAVFLIAGCATKSAVMEEQPIKIVVPAAEGGGSDKLTRFLIGINVKGDYSLKPIIPVNKPGGAGAKAMDYMIKQKGNGNVALMVSNFIVTTPLFQNLPFSYRDLTPICIFVLDNFVLWVHQDSPWKSAEEFITEARQRSITVGGTGSKQEDEIVFRAIQMSMDTKPFKYVPFRGGGAVAKALVGKHLEASVNQVSEASGFYPEFLRPLAVFQDERLGFEGLENVLTGKEAGIPVTYNMMRAIFAPPGISEEDRNSLIELFRDITSDYEWKVFTDKTGMQSVFIVGDEMMKFCKDFEKVNKDVLINQGWIRRKF